MGISYFVKEGDVHSEISTVHTAVDICTLVELYLVEIQVQEDLTLHCTVIEV